MNQIAHNSRKRKTVAVRCAHCRRQVRRKPGSRYCSGRCEDAAYRDRKAQRVLLLAAAVRLEALRIDAARERVRAKAKGDSTVRVLKDLLFTGRDGRGHYTTQGKVRMYELLYQERAAIDAAPHLADIPGVRAKYGALREPIVQEALKRPYQPPKLNPVVLAAASGRVPKGAKPRQKKPKRNRSPMEIGDRSTTGRGKTPAAIVVERSP